MNLEILKRGYFILYSNEGGLFGDAIERRQLKAGFSAESANYTHVEVSGGGAYSVNISPPISKLIKITERHKGRYIIVVRYKNLEYEQGKRHAVAYFSATLCNRGYDLKGVLSFIFKWIKQSNRLWFCSEGASWSLQMKFPEAGSYRVPSKWMPAHFYPNGEFEKVWEGRIL